MAEATLVTIHGFWSSPATWERLADVWRADEQLRGVEIHAFGYESPRKPRLPLSSSRVPDHDDIAQSFATEYRVLISSGPVVIVTHSQGGLILQRFLAWMLQQGRGRELARIASVVMLACPNNGSDYLRSLRRALGFGRHPQAKQLDVLNRQVADTQRTVLADVVNACEVSDRQCPIPFHVYAGRRDGVVLAASAQAAFPGASTVVGNHFSILDPSLPGNLTAETVSFDVAADISEWRTKKDTLSDLRTGIVANQKTPGGPLVEGPVAYGGSVVLRGEYVAGHDITIADRANTDNKRRKR